MQEELVRANALRGMLGAAEYGPLQFRTELGTLEYHDDGYKGGFRLVDPANPKGQMFARIERLFSRVAGNIVNPPGSTVRVPETVSTWINLNQWWGPEGRTGRTIAAYPSIK